MFGWLDPHALVRQRHLLFDIDRPNIPPEQLLGLSGAGVFVGNYLVGIVSASHLGGALKVVPIVELVKDPTFCNVAGLSKNDLVDVRLQLVGRAMVSSSQMTGVLRNFAISLVLVLVLLFVWHLDWFARVLVSVFGTVTLWSSSRITSTQIDGIRQLLHDGHAIPTGDGADFTLSDHIRADINRVVPLRSNVFAMSAAACIAGGAIGLGAHRVANLAPRNDTEYNNNQLKEWVASHAAKRKRGETPYSVQIGAPATGNPSDEQSNRGSNGARPTIPRPIETSRFGGAARRPIRRPTTASHGADETDGSPSPLSAPSVAAEPDAPPAKPREQPATIVRSFSVQPSMLCPNDEVTVSWSANGSVWLAANGTLPGWTNGLVESAGVRRSKGGGTFTLSSGEKSIPLATRTTIVWPESFGLRGITSTQGARAACDAPYRVARATLQFHASSSVRVKRISNPTYVSNGMRSSREICVTHDKQRHCLDGEDEVQISTAAAGDWNLVASYGAGEPCSSTTELALAFDFFCPTAKRP